MRAFAQVEVTTIELPEALLFRVQREGTWIFGLAGMAVTIFLASLGWSRLPLVFFAFGLVGLASVVVNWMRGGKAELRVTASELVATGNLESMFATEIRVPASDVTSLEWNSEGESGPGGLCVKRGWTVICVLPGLDEDQANGIAEAILKRFPAIGGIDRSPASFLFGSDGGLITLGLSGPEDESSETQEPQGPTK
jgi:hypothetical protein